MMLLLDDSTLLRDITAAFGRRKTTGSGVGCDAGASTTGVDERRVMGDSTMS